MSEASGGAPVASRRPLVPTGLVLADVVALSGATLLSGAGWGLAAAFGALLLVTRSVARAYRPRLRLSILDDLPLLLITFGVAAAPVLLWASYHDLPHVESLMLGTLGAGLALTTAVHAVGRFVRRRWRRGERTLVLGAGVIGQAVAETMIDHPELGLQPVGFVDPDPFVDDDSDLPLPLLEGDLDKLIPTLEKHEIQSVVLCFVQTRETYLVDTAIDADSFGCTVYTVPRLFELHHDGPNVERLRGYPLVRLNRDPVRRPSWYLKRAADVVLGSLACIALSPVAAVCALAVLIESGRPILFAQERVGRDAESFRIYKFRSMRPVDDTESQTQWSIAGDERVGPVGRFLRRTSLDELPQLWNIATGRMSIVGPRPERPVFVRQFSDQYLRYWARHRVPAGLTGLAQVNGLRGDTSIEERARFDNYYIANWSLWLDVKIVAQTFRELFRGGQH